MLAASKLEVPAPTVKSEIEEVFYVLGQAMHAVQDFYAHSNYVELKTPHVSRVTDLEIVLLWREAGRAQLTKLQQEGLVSGYVFWGFPQKCKSGTPSHADLAKDSALTTSGRKKVSHLQNTNLYEIAVFLARESSIQMLQDAFKRWPILKEANGNDIAFEVLIDRRGL